MNRKNMLVSTIVLATIMSGPAVARDDKLTMSIAGAMAANDAKARLGDEVKFFFGKAPKKISRRIGMGQTNKKTNSVGKSPEQACNWTFLSALLQLKAEARSRGANAVVNIKSNYDNVPMSSTTEFECHDGALMTGVALKGEYVKIGK